MEPSSGVSAAFIGPWRAEGAVPFSPVRARDGSVPVDQQELLTQRSAHFLGRAREKLHSSAASHTQILNTT